MRKRVEEKLWGWEDIFALNEICSVKILNIKPRQKLSLQKHKNRDEFWKVIEGNCKVRLGKAEINAKPGDEFFIKRSKLHRAGALSKVTKILEISFGKFDPNDITRVEDDYGRAI